MPTFLSEPVDVTPGSTGWQDVDITSHVGGDAGSIALAFCQVVNDEGGVENSWGTRKNGSTDTLTNVLEDNSHQWFAVGVDADDIFEINLADVTGGAGAQQFLYLLGYATTAEAGNLTNATLFDPTADGTFYDVDISTATGGDTATCACFLLENTGGGLASAARGYAIRRNGSTDNRYAAGQDILGADLHGCMMSVDASEICEFAHEASDGTDLHLLGWLTANFTAITNATDYSTATTGSYVTTDMSTDITSGDIAAFEWVTPSEGAVAIRKNGGSHDVYFDLSEVAHGMTKTDGSAQIQQKIESSDEDLYLWGYAQEPAGGGLSIPVAMNSYRQRHQSVV